MDWGGSVSEWLNLKASLTQQLQYTDNMSLSSTQPQATFGYFLNPSLQASHKAESFDINVKAQGNIKFYDNPLWDCQNYTLALNSQYNTHSSVFKMIGGYGISCAYSQQIQETGVILPNAQSTNYNLAPSWSWQWTQRSQLSLGATYKNTSYSGGSSQTRGSPSSTSYTNFDTYTINLGLNYAWDRDLTLNGGLTFMNSQYMGSNPSTQHSFNPELGGRYFISQHWSVNLSGGLRWTDVQANSVGASPALNTSSISPQGNFNLVYKDSLNTTFSTGYSNTIMPSSIGQTLQYQSIYGKFLYQLYPHLSISINSMALQSLPISGQSTSSTQSSIYNRETVTNTVAFTWNFANDWQLRGSYIYRWQKFQQQASAESNTVMLSLNYALDEIEDLTTGKYNFFNNQSAYSGTTENRGY